MLRFTDQYPLWIIFAFLVVLFFISDEIGFFLGKRRQQRSRTEEKGLISTFLGASLGLLAFVLAFTFSMAATHHGDRKDLVVEEANAIGTAYLRTKLLPEQPGSAIRDLLREYVDVRVTGAQSGDIDEISKVMAGSEELHEQMWEKVSALSKEGSGPVQVVLFFADSLNDVIDLHSKRITSALRNRIPGTIVLALVFVAVMSMTMMGYHAGLTGVWLLIPRIALILAFASIFLLIIELDRPLKSAIRVNQQAMIDLQTMMDKDRRE